MHALPLSNAIKQAFHRQFPVSATFAKNLLQRLSDKKGFICIGNITEHNKSSLLASAHPKTNTSPTSVVMGLSNYPSDKYSKMEAPAHHYDWFLYKEESTQEFCLYFNDACTQSFIDEILQPTTNTPKQTPEFEITRKFAPTINKEVYLAHLNQIKAHINAGDCYQINYTQRFEAGFTGSPWLAYQHLCKRTDAQFCAFTNLGERQVLCLSPEQFLYAQNGYIQTKPIKGTRARGLNKESDNQLKAALESSQKDRAENLMIVDLLRNDLGRFCEIGSVEVSELFAIESYSNVHHMVSTIKGCLSQDTSLMDAFYSAFPGGSITGAPKIKAMEIIAQLEPFERGPYCGSFYCLFPDGLFWSNIAIRTLYCETGQIYCFGGGGIVADSDPDAEYQESIDKVSIFMKALEKL